MSETPKPKDSLRQLALEVYQEFNKDWKEESLDLAVAELVERIKKKPNLLKLIIEPWANNEIQDIIRVERAGAHSGTAGAPRWKGIDDGAAPKTAKKFPKNTEERIRLYGEMLMNTKIRLEGGGYIRLRHANKEQLTYAAEQYATLAKGNLREQGWLDSINMKLRGDQIVEDVFTEAKLQKLREQLRNREEAVG